MEQMGCLYVVLWTAALGMGLTALLMARGVVQKIADLQQQLDFANRLTAQLRQRLSRVEEAVDERETSFSSASAAASAPPSASSEAAPAAPVEAPPFQSSASQAEVQELPATQITVPGTTALPPTTATEKKSPSWSAPAMMARDVAPDVVQEATVPPLFSEAEPASDSHAAGDASSAAPMEPPTSPPTPPPPTPPSPTWSQRIDWESLVGVKLFSWVAGFALLLAAIFFFRYTIDHGWITPAIRMTIGLAVGIALLVVCELRFAKSYRVTANAVDGAGIAILYATLFAAHSVWHLIPALLSFALMILVTAVAVILALRRDSVFIAILGMAGGFATPALLSTGQDRPLGLFSYLLLLNAGLSIVSYRKRWAPLTILSFLFTILYQWAWVAKFLVQSKLPLALAVFLLFPLTGAIAFISARRTEQGLSPAFRRTNTLSMVMPLLFALYVAANPEVGGSPHLFFGFLACICVGLAVVAAARVGNSFLHPAAAVAALLVSVVWIVQHYSSAAWPGLAFWLAFLAAVYLATPMIAIRFGRSLGEEGARGTVVGALLLAPFALLPIREPATSNPLLLFALMFVLTGVAALASVHQRRWSPYLAAAVMMTATMTSWSSRFVDLAHLNSALALYVCATLLFAVAPLAMVRRQPAMPRSDAHGWLLAAVIAQLLLACGPRMASAALPGIMIVLSFAAVAAFFGMRNSRSSAPMVITAAASWFVLLVWWLLADKSSNVAGSIAAVTFFSLLLLAIAALRKEGAAEDGTERFFSLLAPLFGYGFLLAVAATPELTNPPFPLFTALLLLLLAVAALGVFLQRTAVLTVAVIFTELALLIMMCASRRLSAPTETLLFQLLIAGIVLTVGELALRRASTTQRSPLIAASLVALLFGQIVFAVAQGLSTRPSLPLALGGVLVLLGVTLLLARYRDSEIAPLLAIAPTAVAYFAWRDVVPHGALAPSPAEALLFAAAIYLFFVFAPIVLPRRRHLLAAAATSNAETSLLPYASAALAGLPFFLFARTSVQDAGFGSIIGLLPLFQAALMGMLLLQLLRLEPRGSRSVSRLVLVAATALAFLTVAVPLQLDKQWITVGWALEAAALAWLHRRVAHRALPPAAAILGCVVFARLALNPAVLTYHPRAATPIFNWYLYAYSVTAAALFIAARQLWLASDRSRRIPLLSTLATILLFLLVNIEIADVYSRGTALTFNFNGSLAQDLTYTIAWGAFAIAMLITGIALHNRATRGAAIGLLVVTIFKCFLHDLGELGGLYRVAAFVGLAFCLLAVALLLQKFILAPRQAEGGIP